MKKLICTLALVLCLCLPFQSTAFALQKDTVQQENTLAQKTAVKAGTEVPTYAEAYAAMTALQNDSRYKEGTPWTNFTPYSVESDKTCYYWHGGPLDGKVIRSAGCAAFAFVLSDAAFGDLPGRMIYYGGFKYEDIKPGDILRVENNSHTVIVLQVSDVGVVLAEGNYSGKVHWGRTMSKAEVMSPATTYCVTRYPANYVPKDDPDANTSIASGTLTGGLKWNLTKIGTLTISGKGAIPDYNIVPDDINPSNTTTDAPWFAYNSQISKVVIENGITAIGAGAFGGCRALSAEIAPTVTKIGNHAFRGSSLITVSFPSSVKTIGNSAFRLCKRLISMTVSEGVETIEDQAFRGCTALTYLDMPASIGKVGAGAFMDCSQMTDVTFAPGSKKVTLGDNLFTSCNWLINVTLPKSIDKIGTGMFQSCTILSGVDIPDGAASIGESAFSRSGVSILIIPSSVTSIGQGALQTCPLTDIYFTGSESQWGKVTKYGDTATVVKKVTVHYNYKRPVVTEPDPGTDLVPEPDPGDKHDHVFDENGVCKECGYLKNTGELAGASVTLKSEVELNLYMDFDVDASAAKMNFSYSDKSFSIPVANAEKVNKDGKTLYLFKCPLAAKEMTEKVKVQLINGSTSTATTTYSLVEYANEIIKPDNSEYSDTAKKVVKAMLNYGAACQNYFSYNEGSLANASLSNADKALVDAVNLNVFDSYKDITKTSDIAGLKYNGTTALFKSETLLRYYYLLEDGKNISNYSFKVNGVSVTPVFDNDEYYVDINVKASEFDKDYTLVVSDGTSTHQVTASVYSYLKVICKKDTTNDLFKKVSKSMYNYGNAVKAYAG